MWGRVENYTSPFGRGSSRAAVLVALLAAISALALQPRWCAADEPPTPKYGWREVWTGADAMRDVWLIYTGVTLAPWSEHVYDPGWRVRLQSGYGAYDYTLDDGAAKRGYRGTITYADALGGYHWKSGLLTVKLFAGVSFIDHIVRPGASRGRLVGAQWGAKAAAEIWWDVTPAQWSSLNLSFTTAHDTASARWRYGFNFAEGWSAGPELRFDTNAALYTGYSDVFDEYEGRAGLFATYKWDGYEVTAAGGVAAYVKGLDGQELTPYATLNFLMQF